MRVDDVDKIHGKGFSEAVKLSEHFKMMSFLCFNNKNKSTSKWVNPRFLLLTTPIMLDYSIFKSLKNLIHSLFVSILKLLFISDKCGIDLVRAENTILGGIPAFILNRTKGVKYGIWLGGSEEEAISIKYHAGLITRFLIWVVRFIKRVIFSKAEFIKWDCLAYPPGRSTIRRDHCLLEGTSAKQISG